MRLMKGFIAIFAPVESLPSPATLARDPSSCPDLSSTDIVAVQSSSGENIQYQKYWKGTFNRPVQMSRISGNKGVTQEAKLKVILAGK